MDHRSPEWRHALRGKLNSLKLIASAVQLPMERGERLEFLADLESAADEIIELIDRSEAAATGIPISSIANVGLHPHPG